MNEIHLCLRYGVAAFNLVVLSYFFLGNGIYTLLMVLSLRATRTHMRRLSYQGLEALRLSPSTPAVAIVIPAWNEQDVIVGTVNSALQVDYPDCQVIVVDDGSSDLTLYRLVQYYGLTEVDRAYYPTILTAPVRAFYASPEFPRLLVVNKVRGGKPDALNAGINLSRAPYFCNLDADCLLDRDALLRLIDPIVNSGVETVVSGGIVRIVNGCATKDGRVLRVGLPSTWLERFQVVEYLRSFLFGRTGWHLLGGTLIVSGAFAIFHRSTVIEAGGLCHDTVTEDMDLIVQLHQWAAENNRRIRMSFTSDPVCWTECPSTLPMLGHQRRRWQLGLCQTLWKHSQILFGRKYGVVGWLSVPFHSYIEGLGAAVEFLGYLMIPLGLFLGMVPPGLLVLFILLGFVYGSFLSVGAVLLEELSYHRYSRWRDLLTLLVCAVFENVGYRQLVLYYRFQGVLKFLAGSRRWEKSGARRRKRGGRVMRTRLLGQLGCTGERAKKRGREFEFPAAFEVFRLAARATRHPLITLAAFAIFALPAFPAGRNFSVRSFAAADRQAEEPSRLEILYRQRAETNPKDTEAFEGMALLQVRRGDYTDAIASYRKLLELTPNNYDASVGMARALAWVGQYDASRRIFASLLQGHPGDTDALEAMARVEMWAGDPVSAYSAFRTLTMKYPENIEYALGLARVEMELRQYAAARATLTAVLKKHPHNRDAELQLANLYLYQGHPMTALRQFNRVVNEDPTNREALEGNARIAYYRGDVAYAQQLTAKLVNDDPRDVSSLLLLARLERALHHSRLARELVGRVETLDSRNPDARELENSLYDDARPTFHTSASFAREVSSGDAASAEDLRTFGYENTWGFKTVPRSDSYFSLAYLPSQSPSGGIRGAVGPAQVLYRQTAYITPYLTVRSGVGLARFGPGALAGIPSQAAPITSAGIRPLGFGDVSYSIGKKFTVDFAVGRSAIAYTPTTVRLGVVEDRLSIGLGYNLNSKTEFHVEPFVNRDSTATYRHELNLLSTGPTFLSRADRNRGAGTSVTFNRKLFHVSTVAVDVGYDGLVYGYSGGGNRPYLGFFNPSFYQRHYLTTHFAGRIHGPLGFDFSSGAGVQQVERTTRVKAAMILSPALTLTASHRLHVSLGYTYYNSSQSLGTLRGDAVQLTTDWKF